MPKRSAGGELLGCKTVWSRQRLRLSKNLLSEWTQTLLHEQLHRAGGVAGGTTNRLPSGIAIAILPVHSTATSCFRQISKVLQLESHLLPEYLLLGRRSKALSTAETKYLSRDHHIRPAIQCRLDQRFHRQSCNKTMNKNTFLFLLENPFYGELGLFWSPASFTWFKHIHDGKASNSLARSVSWWTS